jgi:serine/threonine-protein kinase
MDEKVKEDLKLKFSTREDLDSLSLSPYTIEEEIGRGGMGAVYRARHKRLDKVVAIKKLDLRLVDDERRRKRFEVEAKATSALSHPNIISVFDYGVDENGSPILLWITSTARRWQMF